MPTNKDVPRHALRFSVPCEFGDNGPAAKTAPVKMLARSGQPIEHWYWGNVVHDLAGMRVDKPSLPIDYCHDCDEVLGYVNKFDTTSGDLVLSGAVIPYTENDRASEVIYKQKAGVPYEASINFGGDGIRVQEVAPGEATEVNGYQFEGPGLVIRQWPLRGVAICPYGADSGTSTQFSEKDDGSKPVTVTLFSKQETQMSTTATPAGAAGTAAAAPATQQTTPPPATEAPPAGTVELAAGGKPAEGAATPATTPVTATPPVDANKPAGDHKAFTAAFGDKGALWFLEGKSFQDATTEFVGSLRAEHTAAVTALKAQHQTEVDALKAQVTSLSQKLEGVKLGNDPVTFQSATPDPKAAATTKFAGKLPDNLAMVAAATRMPGAKA